MFHDNPFFNISHHICETVSIDGLCGLTLSSIVSPIINHVVF